MNIKRKDIQKEKNLYIFKISTQILEKQILLNRSSYSFESGLGNKLLPGTGDSELGSLSYAGWQPSMNFGRTTGWSPIPEEPQIWPSRFNSREFGMLSMKSVSYPLLGHVGRSKVFLKHVWYPPWSSCLVVSDINPGSLWKGVGWHSPHCSQHPTQNNLKHELCLQLNMTTDVFNSWSPI